MNRLKIVLADDHAIVLEGLRRVLDQPGFEIAGAVGDGRALVRAARELHPDVIVADITMPLLNGIDAARQIRKADRKVKIIFLTMHPDVTYATYALEAGGSGYVLKSSAGEELITAIREVMRGGVYVMPSIAGPVMQALTGRRRRNEAEGTLTERQREVLQLLAEGRSAKEVATTLNLSSRTVEFHKYRIMAELGLRTTAELTRYAIKSGISGITG